MNEEGIFPQILLPCLYPPLSNLYIPLASSYKQSEALFETACLAAEVVISCSNFHKLWNMTMHNTSKNLKIAKGTQTQALQNSFILAHKYKSSFCYKLCAALQLYVHIILTPLCALNNCDNISMQVVSSGSLVCTTTMVVVW